jgi:hypothetical protein
MNQNTQQSESRVDDLLKSLGRVSEQVPAQLSESANQARSGKIELDGREQFFSLRGRWSILLTIWISSILLFQASLTIGVGRGWFDFLHYEWFLPMVIGQSFLQIIGMGFVVVKFLYADAK